MSGEDSGNNAYTYESQADLVVGIDFGTTFSGVAFALTANIINIKDKSKIIDQVHVIKTWPGDGLADKVPSVISYAGTPPSWGFRVKASDEKRVAHFKLGLQKDVQSHYSPPLTNPKASALGGYLSDHNWRHPLLPTKKPVDFASDYLTGIYNYVSNESLDRHYGQDFLQRQQVSYVITVPAIWGDEARELTRQAAVNAGIQRRKLMLITEPEAAALYCSSMCKRQQRLKVGDRFLICDAGGGTVVNS